MRVSADAAPKPSYSASLGFGIGRRPMRRRASFFSSQTAGSFSFSSSRRVRSSHWDDGRPAHRAASTLPLDDSRKLIPAPTEVCPLGAIKKSVDIIAYSLCDSTKSCAGYLKGLTALMSQ